MKPASADVALITGKRVQGSVKLSSPFFNDVTLTVKHKGKLTSFRNKVNIIYSKKQKMNCALMYEVSCFLFPLWPTSKDFLSEYGLL
jgi:hypothetical protein